MKKILFLLLIASPAFGQYWGSSVIYGPPHVGYLEQTIKLESAESDTIIIGLPSKQGNAYIDSTASDPLPYASWIFRDALWSGYAEFDMLITNVDLAVDSLIAKVYALDRNGVARANDYVYLKFDSTPPGYSTSAYYNAWVSATQYHGSLTGAFGLGVYGFAIIFNPTDETASHSGLLRFRAYLH